MEENKQDLKSEFLEAYRAFEQYKKNNSPILLFDVNAFNQGTLTSRDYDSKLQKYTKKQIRSYLERPEIYERQIREVSLYLYANFQEYKNLIRYFSKMLTHDYILIPCGNLSEITSKKNTKFEKNFFANLEFLENYNLKAKLSVMEEVILREDVYFGYERTDGENFIWQQLPTNYCRILGWDEYGGYTMEFDFSYFTKQNVNINNFPQEFKDGYDLYKTDTNNLRWQKLSDNAIVFKFDKSVLYALPQFSGIFCSILGIADYLDLQEESSIASNYRLLHQQIPQNLDKDAPMNDFKIEDKAAVKFHNNVVRNTKGNHIGVVTTPMKITAINLSDSKIDEDLVGKAEKNLFIQAGVSQLLFSSDNNGSIGLNRSIESDSALMFSLLRQEELFVKKRLRLFNQSIGSKFKWKVLFPDVTIFNQADYKKEIVANAQFGYSKFCNSMSQSDLIALLYIENTLLNMVDKMIPLQSSHTIAGEGEVGKPKSSPTKLSPEGEKTVDTEANKNKSQ